MEMTAEKYHTLSMTRFRAKSQSDDSFYIQIIAGISTLAAA